MNKLFFIWAVLMLLSCQNEQDRKQKHIITNELIDKQHDKYCINQMDSLKQIDYSYFCTKPISALLEKTFAGNYNSHYFIDEPPFKLSNLVLTYDNKMELDIYTGKLFYQNRMNYDMKWSFDLIKKEEYKRIELYSGDSLLLRCDCEN